MILITGGTGLVGSHLILQLLEKKSSLRILYRSEAKKEQTLRFLEQKGISASRLSSLEWIKGDILDLTLLNKAVEGTQEVYHCAALISFDTRDYKRLRKINIEGTANVVNTCLHHGISKLCYVSSIAALGKPSNNKWVTEEQSWNPQQNNNVYAITKYGAELEVWRGNQEGLPSIIVNPGVVLGEGLWEHSTEKFFKAVDNGLSYYTKGTTGFVDVKDVVKAMISAMEKDIVNEKFILVGENKTFKDLFSIIAAYRGKKPPMKEVNPWILEVLWRLDWLFANLFRQPRKLTKANARSSGETTFYENKKVKQTLDFTFTPLEETIERISRFH
ncbi:NAD-dependent epimerase/dehydratase family protein [Robertkochia marina]|uniref:NAD-dependent epimerase/dehydratase family protein n=1 Tax=Robertkochia marina TaxID=1227945 RepID=A0A4S3M318_9FLAO|nr:NAD-dependent epimerase/dehydratase family protein [Robertkochia marina]THD69079.1 NAD-dependent epimerase/dehydratase family protein [Robertkochia marina]TRZ44904.1 NAD-dependent epimerase/dehydratase family protein [Robertkochia marina]